ncbi:MAG: methionyl-tRNA formyltransferase [Pseudomonadota bacterium]
MRILFLGNHTVGVESLKALQQCAEVVGVIAHPVDPEDGMRYESVYDYAKKNKLDVIRGTPKETVTYNFTVQKKPDLIFVADYRYLLPALFLNVAHLGTINLHPSLLPKYRGRAPINWAILQGEHQLGLTAHFIEEGMDTGDIIAQLTFEINANEDVGDALQKLYPLYAEISQQVIQDFQKNSVTRLPQNHQAATHYPRRKPEDGLINWNSKATDILNLIRAVAIPYPGAFTFLNNEKVIIWRAHLNEKLESDSNIPGKILVEDSQIKVKCQDNYLLLDTIEYDTQKIHLETGLAFG